MFKQIKKAFSDHPVEFTIAASIITFATVSLILKKMPPVKDDIVLHVPLDAVKSMMDGGNAILFDVDVDFALMVNYIPNHG